MVTLASVSIHTVGPLLLIALSLAGMWWALGDEPDTTPGSDSSTFSEAPSPFQSWDADAAGLDTSFARSAGFPRPVDARRTPTVLGEPRSAFPPADPHGAAARDSRRATAPRSLEA